jgi:hypothetical protein
MPPRDSPTEEGLNLEAAKDTKTVPIKRLVTSELVEEDYGDVRAGQQSSHLSEKVDESEAASTIAPKSGIDTESSESATGTRRVLIQRLADGEMAYYEYNEADEKGLEPTRLGEKIEAAKGHVSEARKVESAEDPGRIKRRTTEPDQQDEPAKKLHLLEEIDVAR